MCLPPVDRLQHPLGQTAQANLLFLGQLIPNKNNDLRGLGGQNQFLIPIQRPRCRLRKCKLLLWKSKFSAFGTLTSHLATCNIAWLGSECYNPGGKAARDGGEEDSTSRDS